MNKEIRIKNAISELLNNEEIKKDFNDIQDKEKSKKEKEFALRHILGVAYIGGILDYLNELENRAKSKIAKIK